VQLLSRKTFGMCLLCLGKVFFAHTPRGKRVFVYNAAASRPVACPEIRSNPDAKIAMDFLWNRLMSKGTFDFSIVVEHSELCRQARAGLSGSVRDGLVFGICVGKAPQLPQGDLRGEYKGRCVCQGNSAQCFRNCLVPLPRWKLPNRLTP
jgi:hypothetical protein